MSYRTVIWDLDDDPDGNVQHCGAHGVMKEEVEGVLENAAEEVSRSSGRRVVFGDTIRGRA